MLRKVLQEVSIFRSLFLRDLKLAEQTRARGCPVCGGRLHRGHYQRKPRGSPIPVAYCVRMSLCCGREGCRHRVLPPSCLFMGRKVHSRVVILVVMYLHQRGSPRRTLEQIEELCGVAVRTTVRWAAFFRNEFPRSDAWRRVRGRVSAAVSDAELPGALVACFLERHEEAAEGLLACAALLAAGEVDSAVQAR